MLKILGFSGNNKVPKDTSFELPDHVTTIERNCTCFHESKTTKEGINLKAFPVKSNSFSLSVIYEKLENLVIKISLNTYSLYDFKFVSNFLDRKSRQITFLLCFHIYFNY
ncbi:hypothetical protein AT5G55010 [Arabidopsis thaliana]|uniref:Uncharacterized protein n=1 Tax=Arabidopsis thaliana TaxID=3702 RepID=Q9FIA5_ARATH|nr:uncharacterized protein AT5G55010 [Arabidopsis thaliana]AED96569.1 hypothetical protein AT5G55010 [Arabidopsis thaliana]BAB10575.1 unnamed protein product [Arabidopsis thaliana]|eukprot:NP_200312.1 hypothetical protein AT5G55010 [Arabidopsis thaliana]